MRKTFNYETIINPFKMFFSSLKNEKSKFQTDIAHPIFSKLAVNLKAILRMIKYLCVLNTPA